jgi:excisionase family DNA binding protein
MIAITPQTVSALAPMVEGRQWIAFVETRNRAGSLVKIEATRHLVARVRAIDNDNPFEVSLLGLVESTTASASARAIQEEYQRDRAKGDWFNATVPLLTFIEKVAQPALVALVQQLRFHMAPAPTVTVEELAKLLNVSVPTIRRRIQDGSLPFVRFGNQYRFVVGDVLATIRQSS